MKLLKYVKYGVEHQVQDLGVVRGLVNILMSANSYITLINPANMEQIDLKIEPENVKGLSEYKNSINCSFYLPENMPLNSEGQLDQESKEYKACIDGVYEILEEIIKKETN